MDNIKQDFTIKDLENISGIKAHTIRIWEKRYNLLEPKRSDTNIRYYSHKNLQKLLNVVLLSKNNYKISKIAKMSEKEILQESREVAFATCANDDAINAFKLSMFQFDKVLFNNTYHQLLSKKTFKWFSYFNFSIMFLHYTHKKPRIKKMKNRMLHTTYVLVYWHPIFTMTNI